MKEVVAALAIGSFVAIGSPALANLDPKVAEFCLKAQDFQGCVNSMSGKQTEKTTTVRQIQQQGANITEGNSCPTGYTYSGGGYCRQVVCLKRGLFGRGHDQYLGGKGMACKGGEELTWDNASQPIRASIDPKCPIGVPEVGYQSTCLEASAKGYVSYVGIGLKFDNNGMIVAIFDEPAKSSRLLIGDQVLMIGRNTLSEHRALTTSPYILGHTIRIVVERGGKRISELLTVRETRIPMDVVNSP